MGMKTGILVGIGLLCVGLAGNVSAQDVKETGPYVVLNSNYLLNYEGDIEGLREGSVHGFNVGMKLGYDLNKYFAVELESGWAVLDEKTDEAAVKDALGVAGITDAGNLHVIPLLVNVPIKYPMDKFVPYAVGGTGVFFFAFQNDEQVLDEDVELDVDTVAYGFKAGAGFDYYLTDSMALNFESGFWFMADPDLTLKTSSGDLSAAADTDSWYIGGGLKFRF